MEQIKKGMGGNMGLFSHFLKKSDINYEENAGNPENEEIRLLSEVLAEVKGITFAEAFSKLNMAKEKYGLEPEVFAFNGLYRKSEKEIAAFAKERSKKQAKTIADIAKVTGWSLVRAQEETKKAYERYGIKPSRYYSDMYYCLTDEEIAAKEDAENKEFQRCVKWVMDETGWTEYEVKRHRYYCRLAFGILTHLYSPTRCWQMDDATLKTFARQRDSKKLRDKYNDRDLNILLSNKIRFNKEFSSLLGRKFWINRDTSFEEFLQFTDGLDELFCKPVSLSRGVGTKKVKVEGNLKTLYDNLMAQPRMLVEECVKQHHEMSEFYSNSVNTVRLFCILDNDRFVPFAGFVRFGADGVADNIGAGGLGCGLNVKTGTINTPAIDRYHNITEKHPVSGKKFEGFVIPNWDKVLEIAEKGLRHVKGINYVGWDIAICEDKAVLIEGNSLPSIATYQMFYGQKHEGKRDTYKKYLPLI